MVRRIEDELFAIDWAEATARVGEGVKAGDLCRTPRQRRADALLEMAIRAGTAPADGRRPDPLVSVLVGYETFACATRRHVPGGVKGPAVGLSQQTRLKLRAA